RAPWLVIVVLAAACRTTHPVDERDPYHRAAAVEQPEDGGLSVSLRVLTRKGAVERAIADGEVLHSGDRIALSIRTSQQAYVYAVLFGPDGSANVLFPDGEYALASPRCQLRIPRGGTLYLQSPAGMENLHVIASPRPPGEVDRRLCDELHLPCNGAAGKVAPCDPPATEEQRGIIPAVKIGKAPPGG